MGPKIRHNRTVGNSARVVTADGNSAEIPALPESRYCGLAVTRVGCLWFLVGPTEGKLTEPIRGWPSEDKFVRLRPFLLVSMDSSHFRRTHCVYMAAASNPAQSAFDPGRFERGNRPKIQNSFYTGRSTFC